MCALEPGGVFECVGTIAVACDTCAEAGVALVDGTIVDIGPDVTASVTVCGGVDAAVIAAVVGVAIIKDSLHL